MEERKNYMVGVIGALIGGLIASIPWILMYVYGEMILSALAIIIALGALKGYQLLKGKIDGKLPTIIIIVSVICVTISTLLIIPCLLMAKEGMEVNVENLERLYRYNKFSNAIMKDYIVSLLFTFLGVGGVVKSIRKQVYEGKEEIKIDFNNTLNNEQKEIIKNTFIKQNALDKYHAVPKENILSELESSDLKLLFNTLKNQQIIKKYKGKYYYSVQNEKSVLRRFLILYAKIMAIVILITFLIVLLFIII